MTNELGFKFYCAGIYTANFKVDGSLWNRLTENEKQQRLSVEHKLESYHYIHRQSAVDSLRADNQKVFLDSGAFSAFTQGVEIDIVKYCDYIKRNEDIIEKVDGVLMASVLDGIGDPLKTWQNQLRMEELGVRPLPCFHWGEPEEYLDWYVANYDSITLGGLVAQSDVQVEHWLDRIWEKHLIDGSGRPRLRVHGFGVSTLGLMRRYPFSSTDSSSWVQVARIGGMLLTPEMRVINVSDQSPNRRVEGQHLDNLPPIQREAIENRLAAKGVDLARMRETYLARWTYCMQAYSEMGAIINLEKLKEPRFLPDKQGLF